MEWVAGVDEAGRGPLAGPVFAAAVVLNPAQPIVGLADSKKLSPARRAELYDVICVQAVCWAVGTASVSEIDSINILQATLLAMQRAVAGLPPQLVRVLVDGNRCPVLPYPATAIIDGDDSVPVISAASIVAKVSRDRHMLELHRCYPQYEFDCHKGYPTPRHLDLLKQHGACPEHRRTFGPVAEILAPS
jgi:ribonuclease HII